MHHTNPQRVAALALALAVMALPAAVQAGPSRDVADALHGHTDTDLVALDRVERLGDRDHRGDGLVVEGSALEAASPRHLSSDSREVGSADGYPWLTLTRSRDAHRSQDRDGREGGDARGRQDGLGRGDRDERGGHDGHDGHDDHGGRGGHHAHGDRDDFELDEHGHAEGHHHGSDTPVSPVPVPAAAWLLGLGLLGLAATRRHKVTGGSSGASAGAAAA
jgi:hypothetical protein